MVCSSSIFLVTFDYGIGERCEIHCEIVADNLLIREYFIVLKI